MKFLPVLPHRHELAERCGVLLLNLGTPAAPDPAAVRRYLAQFLSDPRVVEIPAPIWWPILHGVILRTRPRRSAAKYASIWTAAGSPLLANSRRQALALGGELARRGMALEVELAMRYGDPSIGAALQRLRERQVRRLLLVPLYPQYSATTSGSSMDGVFGVLARTRDLPELRSVRDFAGQPGYIEALRRSIQSAWDAGGGPPERLVMSFHGLPERNLALGDPYYCECRKTGRLLAQALGLADDRFVITFQSRFGRARWLQPYTSATLQALGRAGTRRVDVVCPGFVADCLETLEEIAIEGRHDFLAAGGGEFRYLPCLNDDPSFVGSLADLVALHVQGWPVQASERQALDTAARERAHRVEVLRGQPGAPGA